MASDRVNSGSKGFDFGSDDILCSYDDFANQEDSSNGPNSDPAIAANKVASPLQTIVDFFWDSIFLSL